MDKRIIKTYFAVYDAFKVLLNKKEYSSIIVEDFLKEASISRSTFYAHFKTKEDVLESITRNLFDHIFSHSLVKEKNHDFSKVSVFEYSYLVLHTLYHLYENKDLVQAILKNSTKNEFLDNIKSRFTPIAKHYAQEGDNKIKNIPLEINENKINESFIICIEYWNKNKFNETPEAIASYFFEMIK